MVDEAKAVRRGVGVQRKEVVENLRHRERLNGLSGLVLDLNVDHVIAGSLTSKPTAPTPEIGDRYTFHPFHPPLPKAGLEGIFSTRRHAA